MKGEDGDKNEESRDPLMNDSKVALHEANMKIETLSNDLNKVMANLTAKEESENDLNSKVVSLQMSVESLKIELSEAQKVDKVDPNGTDTKNRSSFISSDSDNDNDNDIKKVDQVDEMVEKNKEISRLKTDIQKCRKALIVAHKALLEYEDDIEEDEDYYSDMEEDQDYHTLYSRNGSEHHDGRGSVTSGESPRSDIGNEPLSTSTILEGNQKNSTIVEKNSTEDGSRGNKNVVTASLFHLHQ